MFGWVSGVISGAPDVRAPTDPDVVDLARVGQFMEATVFGLQAVVLDVGVRGSHHPTIQAGFPRRSRIAIASARARRTVSRPS